MSRPWVDWDHVLKVDPDKRLVDGESYADVCQTGTDAIMVGGTTGVTAEKMARVVDACAEYSVPLYLEPSGPEVVIARDDLDGYLIPTVFNTQNPFFLVGAHKEWAKTQEEPIPWQLTETEAYIVMNPEAAAATVTEADCDLGPADVAAYATVAEHLFDQAIVYVEYSGMLGDPAIVSAAANALDESTLFYGGGVHDYESAKQMGGIADVVVVGDLVHDEGVEAVEATVAGAKSTN